MIITCQECDSRFVLDDKLIKPTGSKVRCSSCKHVFKAFPETVAPSVEEPRDVTPAPAPAAPAPRNLDEGDDLQSELNRELDRLFGLDEGAPDEPGDQATPAAQTPPPVPEPAPAPAEEAPLGSIDDIDLDDLGLGDLDLQASPDMGMPEDLDLSDFDLSDLDLDLSLDDAPSPAAPSEKTEAEESLDFSGLEDSLAGMDAASPGGEDDLGFADVSLSLDDEGPAAPPVFDDDLDFSDLEAALDAPGEAPAAEASAPEEEFDFSDLALSLDGEERDVEMVGGGDPSALASTDGDAAALSMAGLGELDLSLDDEPVDAPGATSGTDSDEGFMELDLDLDLGDDEPLQASLDSSLDEELDLSELEGLLQEEPGAGDAAPEEDDIELELDFDFKDDEKTQELEPLEKDTLDDSDFSDIEAMLEKDDKPLDVEADVNGEVDLELELDLAPEVEEAVAVVPVAAAVAPEASLVTDVAEIDDDEPEPASAAASKPKASRSFARQGRRGSGMRIFLTILLVVVLLFAILVGVYAMRDEIQDRTGVAIPTINAVEKVRESLSGMGIPFVSSWVKPADKDPDGKLHLVTQDVTGRFVVSPSLGDLFVITGKVRNNYGTTRHSISLTGRLYTKENLEVQSKEFFAGNTMADAELAAMTMEEIDQKIKTTLGKDNINARVSPGQLVPFMVVFEKLPDDLAEFAVEVRASREGAAIK
ncbi:DUF3426 domain-containing protein [Desulfoluna spongiiphila]|uniref:MJ0042 family finger-like domain-containing protein n=1 Tax=Desulfoluna spongiiphila TaxID=419481 RepID=A0A1G5I719_9BACT|nr:DUF3426 domain-containing protein [Desulfoluna spongiiphila]SCY71747.1 MJ0042 family finger-like domain-containing protein [Desulfoluna spongiiphila]VVS93251.1 consensus disorder prediction [Desulfoluna spongiiphila]